VRWAKPIRANRAIANHVKSHTLGGALVAPINALLRLRDLVCFSGGTWTIVDQNGTCNEEFTHLAHAVGSRYGCCVQRSAAYLNWRYLQHPLVRHEILTARRDEKLMGYVVFSHTNQDAKIVYLFGFSDTAMWNALVARVVTLLRNRGVVTLSLPALAASPWTRLLKGWGFHPRETAPLVAYPHASAEASAEGPAHWFLMDGDRES
jgi:hypothetical protein